MRAAFPRGIRADEQESGFPQSEDETCRKSKRKFLKGQEIPGEGRKRERKFMRKRKKANFFENF